MSRPVWSGSISFGLVNVPVISYTASTKAIEVDGFIALEEIDPIYYERTYWLAPDGEPGKKAYQLLLAAMEDRGRVAIGTVVMRNKQYLTAIRPLDGALAMSTMRFADEVVPRSAIESLTARRAKPDSAALKMAGQLIDGLAADWNPDKYHDTYVEELRKRIRAKKASKEIVDEAVTTETPANVVDLVAALQASLDKAKRPRKARTRAKKSA
jgi:DNA end-binding protein Ku